MNIQKELSELGAKGLDPEKIRIAAEEMRVIAGQLDIVAGWLENHSDPDGK